MAVSKRKCKQCGEYREAESGVKVPSGWFCSNDHAVAFAMDSAKKKRDRAIAKQRSEIVKKEKAERQEHRTRLLDVKPLSYWSKRAAVACHAFIRARDANCPCISCGATSSPQWDAGHFRPSGVNSALRFDERNIHKQCVRCNQYLSGNLIHYRAGLVVKIGEQAVIELENNHETKRWTREELQEVERIYKERLRALTVSRES